VLALPPNEVRSQLQFCRAMSVLDFAHWAGWNAGAGQRGPRLVGAETLHKLHTPVVPTGPRQEALPGTRRAAAVAPRVVLVPCKGATALDTAGRLESFAVG
jgi:hypothetical protein